MLSYRRAKIIATIGPSISSKENLRRSIEAGINVARLNFSHGSHSEHKKVLVHLRELSRELKAPVAVLQDLQGPKIRVGDIENGQVEVKAGNEVIISTDGAMGRPYKISSDFKELPACCQPGTKIFLDDGLLEFKVIEVKDNRVHCEVVFGGVLKSRKGINLPGVKLPVECLTAKDLKDLNFRLENNVDYGPDLFLDTFLRRG